jgi:hypothetical protein
VVEGGTNRLMAEKLNVSPKTIEKHRANLMQKLNIKTATELVLTALDQRWVVSDRMTHFPNIAKVQIPPAVSPQQQADDHSANLRRRATDRDVE